MVNKWSTLFSSIFTVDKVVLKMNGLDLAKNAGPDGIPPSVLMSCCDTSDIKTIEGFF